MRIALFEINEIVNYVGQVTTEVTGDKQIVNSLRLNSICSELSSTML